MTAAELPPQLLPLAWEAERFQSIVGIPNERRNTLRTFGYSSGTELHDARAASPVRRDFRSNLSAAADLSVFLVGCELNRNADLRNGSRFEFPGTERSEN